MSSQMSHGRGGAGNMANAKNSPKVSPADFKTPTLKSSVVTTGRGGQGNMAKNDDPVETRKRQDVNPVARRYSGGTQHAGRGGAGNIFKDEPMPEVEEQVVVDDELLPPKPKKAWLPFGKKQ